MEKIKFLKMNGQGNDFILVDCMENKIRLSGEEISRMCDRHFGIGADGLILVKKSQKADFFMDYYNRDGSVAEMCGNGIRCMAGFILLNKLSDKKNIDIETRAGIKKISIICEPGPATVKEAPVHGFTFNVKIRVDMGRPIFEPEKIPVIITDMPRRSSSKAGNEKAAGLSFSENMGLVVKDHVLNISGKDFYINCLSMGNPHCVIFLDDETGLKEFPVSKFGPAIENHRIFPNKTNVEFIKVKGDNEIEMRVWERGVGETLACGTGACAAAVCAIEHKNIRTEKVFVNLPGGTLNIYWKSKDFPVFLEGNVEVVYSGIY